MTFRPPCSAGPGPAVTAWPARVAECGVEMPAISQVVRYNLAVLLSLSGSDFLTLHTLKKRCLALYFISRHTTAHELLFTHSSHDNLFLKNNVEIMSCLSVMEFGRLHPFFHATYTGNKGNSDLLMY